MDRSIRHVFKIVAVLIICLVGCACVKLQPVLCEDLGRLASIVKPGDTVRCTFRDGSRTALKVSAVERDTLVNADGTRVAIAIITDAKIEHVDRTKTILLSLGIFAMAAATLILAACALGSRADIAWAPEAPLPPSNEGV